MKQQPRLGPRVNRHQQGVVLVVALIMLVIIGLGSVAVMRNVMNTDLVSENTRRQAQAMQAAQTALRYCETQIEAGSKEPEPASATNESWKTFSKWTENGTLLKDGKPLKVPADIVNSGSNDVKNVRYSANDSRLPQCMAQSRSGAIIVVTARGFSDNYVAGTNGITQAGAVVWLQSVIQLAADDAG